MTTLHDSYCPMLNSSTGIFSDCSRKLVGVSQSYSDACELNFCVSTGNVGKMYSLVCNLFKSFAEECAEVGSIVSLDSVQACNGPS